MRAYLLALAILGSAAPQAVNAPTAVTNGAGPSFTQPRPAPPTYVSVIYGLTFPSPPGTTYCPLPDGWIGSDHGTILFLEPPTGCGDAGYPSSARGFVSRRTPRIQLYYGYVVRDDPVGQRCPGPPVMEFLGRARPLCRSHDDGMVEVTVSGWYGSDSTMQSPTEAALTLITTSDRLNNDLGVLRRLAASVRPCASEGRRAGSNPECPPGDWY